MYSVCTRILEPCTSSQLGFKRMCFNTNKVHIDNCSKSVNLAIATIPIYPRAVKCWIIQRRLTYFGCWNKLFIEPDVWSFGKKVHLSQKWLQNFNRPDRSKKWTQNSIWREKNKRLIITVARSPEFSNR